MPRQSTSPPDISDQNGGGLVAQHGGIVAALRDNESARDVLQKVGGDEIKFALYENVPVTSTADFIKWLKMEDNSSFRPWLNQSLITYDRLFRKIDFKTIPPSSFEILNPLLIKLGKKPGSYKGIATNNRFNLLSHRALFILTLATDTGRGRLLRDLLKVPFIRREPIAQLFAMGGFIEVPETEPSTKKPGRSSKEKSLVAVRTEEVEEVGIVIVEPPTTSSIQGLVNFFTNSDMITQAAIGLEDRATFLKREVDRLSKELKGVEEAIAKIHLLQEL